MGEDVVGGSMGEDVVGGCMDKTFGEQKGKERMREDRKEN